MEGGLEAAKLDHNAVMAPKHETYFDHFQAADTKLEPLSIGGNLPIGTVYLSEPVPAGRRTSRQHPAGRGTSGIVG